VRQISRAANGRTASRRQLGSHEDSEVPLEAGQGRSLPRIDLNRPFANRPQVEADTAREREAANRRFQGQKRPGASVWHGSTVKETEQFIREGVMLELWGRDQLDRRIGGLSLSKPRPAASPWEDLRVGLVRIGTRMLFKYRAYPLPLPDGWRVATSFNLVVSAQEARWLRVHYGLTPNVGWSTDLVAADALPGGWVVPDRVFAVEGVKGDLDASLPRAFLALQEALRRKGHGR
jgi:hypothetical protein